jgi:hypothetical protein
MGRKMSRESFTTLAFFAEIVVAPRPALNPQSPARVLQRRHAETELLGRIAEPCFKHVPKDVEAELHDALISIVMGVPVPANTTSAGGVEDAGGRPEAPGGRVDADGRPVA